MSLGWVEQLRDKKMKELLQLASNVAPRKATVLVCGESGVGKELLARYIHQKSSRKDNPFIAVNCAAVPENLLESELFGFEKGAFTGAQQTKPGKFEMAHKGTFLLDEVSELPLSLQGKLLRVLQESEVERLGANEVKKIDVRFVCTSNRNLSEMVQKGEFRQDLFYRLNVIPLNIPPLRDRGSDIDYLVNHFLTLLAKENDMEVKSMSSEAMEKIRNWSWPGNIRELRNVLERSCLLASNAVLSANDIRIESQGTTESIKTESHEKPGLTIHEAEKRLILKTLEVTNSNRTRAAKMLGISIRTLRNKLNEYKSDGELSL